MEINPNNQITSATMRQIGDDEFRLATPKDIKEGMYLSQTEGLTIRAYIATKAMQGLASVSEKGTFESHEDMYKQLAEHSVKIADQLITELNKK